MIHHHQMLRAKRFLDSQTFSPTASPTQIVKWFSSIAGMSTIIIVGVAVIVFIIVVSVLSVQQKEFQERRKRDAEMKRSGIRTKVQPPKGKKSSRIPPPPPSSSSKVSSSNRRTDPTIDLFYSRQEEFKSSSGLPHHKKTDHVPKPQSDDIPEPLMIPSISLPAMRKGIVSLLQSLSPFSRWIHHMYPPLTDQILLCYCDVVGKANTMVVHGILLTQPPAVTPAIHLHQAPHRR